MIIDLDEDQFSKQVDLDGHKVDAVFYRDEEGYVVVESIVIDTIIFSADIFKYNVIDDITNQIENQDE